MSYHSHSQLLFALIGHNGHVAFYGKHGLKTSQKAHKGDVDCISSNQTHLITGCQKNEVIIWGLDRLKIISRIQLDGGADSFLTSILYHG